MENTQHIQKPNRPDYHLTPDLADHAIKWIRTQQAIAPIIQPILFKLSNAGLLVGLVVRLIVHTNDIIGLLQTGAILVCAVFIVFSFTVGYLLGGPGIDTQRVLGVGTAQRNFALTGS